jgi:hypothetical protein
MTILGQEIPLHNNFFVIFFRDFPQSFGCSARQSKEAHVCLVLQLHPDIDLVILHAAPISKQFPAHRGRCHFSSQHFMYHYASHEMLRSE